MNKTSMNKIERMRAALEGKSVDRAPYGFWSHFPQVDRDPEALTRTMVQFVSDYDTDFIKIMSNGMYAVEDFGCECDFSEVERGGVAKLLSTPIESPEDWKKVRVLSPDAPALSRELKTLALTLKELKGKLPVLFTVFSPLTVAEKLSRGKLRAHLDGAGGPFLHGALEAIAETVSELSRKAIEMGADGVFFATQTGRRDFLTPGEYREFGRHYDLKALEGAQAGWCNAVHIHGEDVYFDDFCDYPVHILNWHVWETAPEIAQAMKKTDKCLMGGIKRFSITGNSKDEISAQIWASLAQSGGRRHIVTPGCVVRLPLPEDALKQVERAITEASEAILRY